MTTPTNNLIEEAVKQFFIDQDNIWKSETGLSIAQAKTEERKILTTLLTKHEDSVLEQIDQIIIGWREKDWPEGFDRRTAQMIADNYEKRTDHLRANQSDHE